MPLLTKLEYLQVVDVNSAQLDSPPETVQRVIDYASNVWESLGLKSRKLKEDDLGTALAYGNHVLFHLKAFPRKMPETVVIVVADETAKSIHGHILIDLSCDQAEAILDCPSCEFEDVVDPKQIDELIPQIQPDDDNPFAILSTGDGTYIQTLNDGEGYILEYQLVNTSSHYEVPELVSLEQVLIAFKSYATGTRDWMTMFPWQIQELGD